MMCGRGSQDGGDNKREASTAMTDWYYSEISWMIIHVQEKKKKTLFENRIIKYYY